MAEKTECCRLLLLLLLLAAVFHFSASIDTSSDDRYALLAFKAAISGDPSGALAGWKPGDELTLHCRWDGILCTTIGHEHRVVGINLPDSSLSGSIPGALQALSQLQRINLRNNSFSGAIPGELTRIRKLHKIILGRNRLSGTLPRDLSNLADLEYVDLSDNLLEGSIPAGLGQTKQLEHLNLSGNILTGNIPRDLRAAGLDLSRNNLSGAIPPALRGTPPAAFDGNRWLCGAPLRRSCRATAAAPPPVPHRAVPRNVSEVSLAAAAKGGLSVKEILAIVVGDAVGIVLLGLVFIYCVRRNRICRYFRRRRRNRGGSSPGGDSTGSTDRGDHCCLLYICCCCCGDRPDWLGDESGTEGELVLFETDRNEKLTFDLEDLLRASAYVISKGGSGGIVYKAVLESGVTLAVRRLAADAVGGGPGGLPRKQKLFDTEVQILGRIRHPCIVKLRAYYSGPDEKLLVYDYIPNGSLATALHSQIAPYSLTSLTWAERVRIARRVAEGLAHIHECGPKKYIHGDIRPKNILLSSNMDAFISDFGLSRLITISGSANNSRSGSRNANTSAALASAAVVVGTAGGTGLNSGVSVEADYNEFRDGHLETEAYRPPEARLASSKPTQKWDVYSFGVVMLELISGKSATQHLKQQEMEQWQQQFQQHLAQQQQQQQQQEQQTIAAAAATSTTVVGSSNESTTPPSTAPTTPPSTPAATPSTPRTPSTPTPTPTSGSKAVTPTTTTSTSTSSTTMPLVEWACKMWEGKRPVFEMLDPTLMHGIAPQQKDVTDFLRIALSCVAVASEQRPKMKYVSETLKKIGG